MAVIAVISANHKNALSCKAAVCKFVQCPSMERTVYLHSIGVTGRS